MNGENPRELSEYATYAVIAVALIGEAVLIFGVEWLYSWRKRKKREKRGN